jgi:hypothetical protein
MESAATTAVGSVATFEGLTARAPYTVRARSVFLDPQLSDRLGQWGPWIELEGAPHHGVLVCTGAGGGGRRRWLRPNTMHELHSWSRRGMDGELCFACGSLP